MFRFTSTRKAKRKYKLAFSLNSSLNSYLQILNYQILLEMDLLVISLMKFPKINAISERTNKENGKAKRNNASFEIRQPLPRTSPIKNAWIWFSRTFNWQTTTCRALPLILANKIRVSHSWDSEYPSRYPKSQRGTGWSRDRSV